MEKYELKKLIEGNAEVLIINIKDIEEDCTPGFSYESILTDYEQLKSNFSGEKDFEKLGGSLLLKKYESAIEKFKKHKLEEISDEDLIAKIEAIDI